MGMLKELSVGGLFGLLAGLGLVSWVEPTTTGGTVLLIFVCVAVGTALGGLFSAGKGKKEG